MNILDTKNCSFEKRLIGKLLLKCEDEMLNTTETSLNDKKKPCEKKSLVIINFFLLAVPSISYYYYCTKDWIR